MLKRLKSESVPKWRDGAVWGAENFANLEDWGALAHGVGDGKIAARAAGALSVQTGSHTASGILRLIALGLPGSLAYIRQVW